MAIQLGSRDVVDIEYSDSSGSLSGVSRVALGEYDVWTSEPDYLTLTANTAGSTVSFSYDGSGGGSVFYRKNGGEWTFNAVDGATVTLDNAGDFVQYTASSSKLRTTMSKHFSMTGSIAASGGITTLLGGNGRDTELGLAILALAYCFYKCTALTTPPKLTLTKLTVGAYTGMFSGCTGLLVAPELPAASTTPYSSMFLNCKSLSAAPSFSTSGASVSGLSNMFQGCTGIADASGIHITGDFQYAACRQMFKGCTGLRVPPVISISGMGDADDSSQFYEMFIGCSSLESFPDMDYGKIAPYCFYNMFNGCTSLTAAPELPATALAASCYQKMFYGCSGIRVSENGGEGTAILAVPSGTDEPDNWNSGMFTGTGGSFTGNPQIGETYYCY